MLRDAAATVIFLSVVFGMLTSLSFIFLPEPMIALYLKADDPDAPAIMEIAVGLMFWAALFQLVDALQVQGLGLLRGVQDTRVPMYYAAFSYWIIGLPAAYLFAFPLGFGPPGLWVGLMAGLGVASFLMMHRFYNGLARGVWTREAEPG